MKEITIRKKAIEFLGEGGWIVWYPPKVKWRKDNDIFGCFDLICCQRAIIKFIQLTTLSNVRAREKKIKNFLKENKLKLNAEVWGYDKKKKEFKIITIKGDT